MAWLRSPSARNRTFTTGGRCAVRPSAHESLAKIGGQRLGVAPSFRPFLILANQVSVNVCLVCEVVRDGAVYFFETKQLEVLAVGLRRFAATECMDYGIQRDSGVGNVVVTFALFLCSPLPWLFSLYCLWMYRAALRRAGGRWPRGGSFRAARQEVRLAVRRRRECRRRHGGVRRAGADGWDRAAAACCRRWAAQAGSAPPVRRSWVERWMFPVCPVRVSDRLVFPDTSCSRYISFLPAILRNGFPSDAGAGAEVNEKGRDRALADE